MLKTVGRVVGVFTCWVFGGIAVWFYANHLLLSDAGWKIQYAVIVTGLIALLSLVVAGAIALLLRLIARERRQSNYAVLICVSFVLLLLAMLNCTEK